MCWSNRGTFDGQNEMVFGLLYEWQITQNESEKCKANVSAGSIE